MKYLDHKIKIDDPTEVCKAYALLAAYLVHHRCTNS